MKLSVDPGTVVNRVDEKIYGHFLEHIYHSCNGGLWGDLVWNRSFEQNQFGQWSVQDGQIVQEGMGTNVRLTFGDAGWNDYEFTLEAKKTAGQEGFLILFRVKNDKEFYWCNLGGWGNERTRSSGDWRAGTAGASSGRRRAGGSRRTSGTRSKSAARGRGSRCGWATSG